MTAEEESRKWRVERTQAATLPPEQRTCEEAADERLNWPGVTLHIAASELGVMGETGGAGWM